MQGAYEVPCFCSQHPVFALGSAEVAVALFGPLCLVVHNLPQLHMHTVSFSPLQFLCILLLEKLFVQVQTLQQRVSGPRSKLVSSAVALQRLEPAGFGASGHLCHYYLWKSYFLKKFMYLFLCFTGSLLLHAGSSPVAVCGLLIAVAFLITEHGLLGRETFSGCGTWV